MPRYAERSNYVAQRLKCARNGPRHLACDTGIRKNLSRLSFNVSAILPIVMEVSWMRMLRLIAAVAIATAFATKAKAAAIVDVVQDGSDVVATLSGSLNLTGLSSAGFGAVSGSGIFPADGEILMNGVGGNSNLKIYSGLTGPSNFGTGNGELASSHSGDVFVSTSSQLSIDSGYVSGSALAATLTFDNTTLAGLGLTPGIYDYTWGSGVKADSFQIDVGQSMPVPEPTSLPVFGVGIAALAWISWRRFAAGPRRPF